MTEATTRAKHSQCQISSIIFFTDFFIVKRKKQSYTPVRMMLRSSLAGLGAPDFL